MLMPRAIVAIWPETGVVGMLTYCGSHCWLRFAKGCKGYEIVNADAKLWATTYISF